MNKRTICAIFSVKHISLNFKALVVSMSIFEYDKEKEEKMLRKAEYEAGYNSGKIEGKIENAISFYRLGLPVSRIAEGLKIPIETVSEWIKNETN